MVLSMRWLTAADRGDRPGRRACAVRAVFHPHRSNDESSFNESDGSGFNGIKHRVTLNAKLDHYSHAVHTPISDKKMYTRSVRALLLTTPLARTSNDYASRSIHLSHTPGATKIRPKSSVGLSCRLRSFHSFLQVRRCRIVPGAMSVARAAQAQCDSLL